MEMSDFKICIPKSYPRAVSFQFLSNGHSLVYGDPIEGIPAVVVIMTRTTVTVCSNYS